MFDYMKVYGMNVISIQDGVIVGTIENPVVDAKIGKIVGFWLTMGKKKAKIFLPYEHICLIGKDVALIFSRRIFKRASKPFEENGPMLLMENIIGLPISSEKKEHVGNVSSFHFSEDGKIVYYEVSKGFVKEMVDGVGLISADGVVSLGLNSMTIMEAANEVSDIMKKRIGLKQKSIKVKQELKKQINAF